MSYGLPLFRLLSLSQEFFLQETKSSQSSINIQIQNLVPWDTVKDWRRIEFLGIESNSTKNGEVNDSDGQYLQIAASLKKLRLFIYRSILSICSRFHENFTCYGKFF